MNSDSGSELDIDDLLKDLETESSKATSRTTRTNPTALLVSKGGLLKDTQGSSMKDVKQTEQIGKSTVNAKSVRFSSEIPISPPAQNQPAPSSLLSNMFFPLEGDDTKKSSDIKSDIKDLKSKTIEPSTMPVKKQQKKDDWLALEYDDEEDLTSLLKGDEPLTKNPVPSTHKSKESTQKKSLDPLESNAFSLRWTSETNQSEKDNENLNKKPPLQTNARTKFLSNADSVSSSIVPRNLSAEFPLGNKRSENPQTSVQQTNIEKELDDVPLKPNFHNIQSDSTRASSMMDALSFLRPKTQTPLEEKSQSSAIPGEKGELPTNDSGQKSVSQKKKMISKNVSATGNVNTLQLPSHIVNEDELKTMTSSLKTLYTNQLEMLDVSYKEQLDFLSASNRRREDLLKEEMTNLQEDYDQRIQRLRTELLENETRLPKKMDEEITKMSHNFEKLSTQLETLNKTVNDQKSGDINTPEEIKSVLVDALERKMESQLSNVFQIMETSISKIVRQVLENSTNPSILDNAKHLENIRGQLDKITKGTGVGSSNLLMKFEELQKTHQLQTEQIIRSQKKLRDSAVNSTVSSIAKIFESDRQENLRKRDRTAIQIKESRKDLRRLFLELESKNDIVHKSQISMELEQRNINQSIRDINTLLKISTSGHNFNSNNDSSNNAVNQFATMQAVHQQTQNEMEIKLLRDERNSLSESIAQLNVERRKLADERINHERDKMDFEREKSRLRDFEMNCKAKVAEAEEIKRNAEAIRLKTTSSMNETESKLQEWSKEKSKIKETYFELEQKLILREQKLFQEKSELIREKEFLDKLRDQLLCPGCLSSVKGVTSSLLNLGPPPYYQQLNMRSSGDGTEFGTMPLLTIPRINFPSEENDTNKYLDELNKRFDL